MIKLWTPIFARKEVKKAIAPICFFAVLLSSGQLGYAITVEEKFYYAARDQVYKKDFSGARKTLEKYYKIDPEQQSMNIYTKIVNEVLLRRIKKETGIFIFKAIDYILNESFNEAMAELDKALKINPKYPWIYNYRGVIYTIQQYYDRAKSDFDQAIELNKNELEFYYNRAVINIYQGDIKAAVDDLNVVLHKNKKYRYGKALFRKAYLCESLDDIEEAIAAYRRFSRYRDTRRDVFSREKNSDLPGVSKYDSDLAEYAKWRARVLRERLLGTSR